MQLREAVDFGVEELGPCRVRSPVEATDFVSDDEGVLYETLLSHVKGCHEQGRDVPAFQLAGPRRMIYFDPSKVKSAIVSCGGLCPGINDVIRSLVMCLRYRYGVSNILGIRYGFQGLIPSYGHEVIELTPEMVARIHEDGGSFLSCSRGQQDIGEMVDALERMNVSMLFCIGGDGTLHGAQAIVDEISRRGLKVAVVGLPKTIDNDLCYIDKTFGFETAFTVGIEAVSSAHVEATGAPNGIGLVKTMGRHSGYLAANAALAMNDVNFVLIPEVRFDLEGPKGLLAALQSRLERRRHAVVLVAEGAGQEFFESGQGFDGSGNVRLNDIGLLLKDRINRYFRDIGMEVNLKYIDPSYIVRSTPANPSDSIYCTLLAFNAVHAAMAGKTGVVIGKWNNVFTLVPIRATISSRNTISPHGALWQSVLEVTGQPPSMVNDT